MVQNSIFNLSYISWSFHKLLHQFYKLTNEASCRCGDQPPMKIACICFHLKIMLKNLETNREWFLPRVVFSCRFKRLSGILQIADLQKSDSGSYRCLQFSKSTNLKMSSEAELIVEGGKFVQVRPNVYPHRSRMWTQDFVSLSSLIWGQV